MKTRNLLWLPAVLLMAACGKEEEGSVVSSMPIQFSAEISASRVTGDSWDIGDRVGISMSGESAETKLNLPYVTVQTDGKFNAEGEDCVSLIRRVTWCSMLTIRMVKSAMS